MIMKNLRTLISTAMLLSLAACTSTITNDVTKEGMVSDQPYFPKIEDSYRPEGVFPNRDNLHNIAPGMTKKQLYRLIGRPHFDEINGAREWDFIFKFREYVNGPVKVCQYKVTFDHNRVAQGFYWLPHDCESQYYRTNRQQKIALSADALFDFNKGGINDIKPGGRIMLDKLAQQTIKEGNTAKLAIQGYTDRIGNDAYNQQLSAQRANSVKAYLTQRGVKSTNISAIGKGESNPVVQCNNPDRTALISCLAPNRRVTIDINQ